MPSKKVKKFEQLRVRISEEAYFILRDAARGELGSRRAGAARRLIRLGREGWKPPRLEIDGTAYRVMITEGAMYRYVSFGLPRETVEWIRATADLGFGQNWLVSKLIIEGHKWLQVLERELKLSREEVARAGRSVSTGDGVIRGATDDRGGPEKAGHGEGAGCLGPRRDGSD